MIIAAGGKGAGSNDTQLNKPSKIAIDQDGALLILDGCDYGGNPRVVKWFPGSESGTLVAGGNGEGGALDQLQEPRALTIDQDGALLILDGCGILSSNPRVVKWVPGSESGTLVAGGNGRGTALDQLDNPSTLTIDQDGALLILDGCGILSGNPRVVKWLPGSESGTLVAGGNGRGTALDQLQEPSNIAIDQDGALLILDGCDYGGDPRVVKWLPGSKSGTLVAQDSFYGSLFDQLKGPSSFYVNNLDLLHIDDS